MKNSSQIKSKLENVEGSYALAKELYNKRRKNASEIKNILKEKGIHIETVNLIVKDVEMYAEVRKKIKTSNAQFLGLMFLICAVFLCIISPQTNFQSEPMQVILIIGFGLSGIVLCLIGISKPLFKKSFSKK